MKRLAAVMLVTGVLASAAAYVWIRQELDAAPAPNPPVVVVEFPRGMGTRDVFRTLVRHNIIRNEHAALAYLWWTGNRGRLQAGEYRFDRPLKLPEVLQKLVRGDVYLHKLTIPEGLTIPEVARKWMESGFGSADDFREAADRARKRLTILGLDGDSIEGALFPDTYLFPSRTTAERAVEAMVDRFKANIDSLRSEVPESRWPLPLGDTLILASLIESEAQHDDERPVIASVFLNRLRLRMSLDCDPTVIYGLEKLRKYSGRLTRADLKINTPYNTYMHRGLPPGPISNPGLLSLRAAVIPAESKYLFFVRTEAGRHKFSENLRAHNRAVAEYRAMVRRSRGN